MGEQIVHPWMEIASVIKPEPAQSIVKFDKVEMVRQDGMLVDVVLVTIANPGGLASVYLDRNDFKNMLDNATSVYDEMSEQKLMVSKEMPPEPIDLGKFRR